MRQQHVVTYLRISRWLFKNNPLAGSYSVLHFHSVCITQSKGITKWALLHHGSTSRIFAPATSTIWWSWVENQRKEENVIMWIMCQRMHYFLPPPPPPPLLSTTTTQPLRPPSNASNGDREYSCFYGAELAALPATQASKIAASSAASKLLGHRYAQLPNCLLSIN